MKACIRLQRRAAALFLLGFCGGFFPMLFSPNPLFAQVVGELTQVSGRVDVTSPGGNAIVASTGDSISQQDIVRTKSDGRAEITFTDGSIVRVAPGSRIGISEYRIGDEGRSQGRLSLFRGKVRSLVSGVGGFLGRRDRGDFEVNTPTMVSGVRGTDFFVYYQRGISGAIFKEGEGYGYNVNYPDQQKKISAGEAMLVYSARSLPTLRPVAPFEIGLHVESTRPSAPKEEEEGGGLPPGEQGPGDPGQGGIPDPRRGPDAGERGPMARGPGGPRMNIFDMGPPREIRETMREFSYTIDIESFDAEEGTFYTIGVDAAGRAGIRIPGVGLIPLSTGTGLSESDIKDQQKSFWSLYVGDTAGIFSSLAGSGGQIFLSPMVREVNRLSGESWTLENLYYSGTYVPFKENTFDDWSLLLDYEEKEMRQFVAIQGSKWSQGAVAGNETSAWVNWQDCITGVGGGDLSGAYSPANNAWQATGRRVSMRTENFLEMASTRPDDLAKLNIPAIEVGRAALTGSGNHLTVHLPEVAFFAYSTAAPPRLWAAGEVAGAFTDTPQIGTPVPLSGDGLQADFVLQSWGAEKWNASIDNGTGTLSRIDGTPNRAIRFQGAGAGDIDAGAKTFSGTGAGIVIP